VSFAAVASKFVPVTVTDVPMGPLKGENVVIVGTKTVKLLLLVPVWLPTVTAILPVVAAVGTVATICVVLAEVTVAAVPLNLTVSLDLVALKLVPFTVTEVPTVPLVGANPATVGAAAHAGEMTERSSVPMIRTRTAQSDDKDLARHCAQPLSAMNPPCSLARPLTGGLVLDLNDAGLGRFTP
jgi:hypothetical protein